MRRLTLALSVLCFAAVISTGTSEAEPGGFNLGNIGGPGGQYFRDLCPDGQRLVGVEARSGSYVDQIVPLCAPYQIPEGATVAISTVKLSPHGGNGGGYNPGAMCTEADEGIWAMTVGFALDDNHPTFVNSILFHCGDPTGGLAYACLYTNVEYKCTGGAPDTGATAQNCPDGMIAVGLRGNSGNYLDSVALVCAVPPPPPPNIDIVTRLPGADVFTKPNIDVVTRLPGADVLTMPAGPPVAVEELPGTGVGVLLGKRAFAGDWDTVTGGTHYQMHLDETDEKVTGSYEPNGGTIDGGFVPSADGTAMLFKWSEASGQSGTGAFILAPGGELFSGRYLVGANGGDLSKGFVWDGTRVASVGSASPASPQPTGPAGYLITCRGGGDMTAALTKDGFVITFALATAGADDQPPGPGECAWSDRATGENEPQTLVYSSGQKAGRPVVQAAKQGGAFKLHAFNNKDALVVSSIDEAEIVAGKPEPAPAGPPANGPSKGGQMVATVIKAVNVHTGPGNKYPAIPKVVLPAGLVIVTTECTSSWCQLALPGGIQFGWVSKKFLAFGAAGGPGPSLQAVGENEPDLVSQDEPPGGQLTPTGADFSGAWQTTGSYGENFQIVLTEEADGSISGSYPKGTIFSGTVKGKQLLAQYAYGGTDTGQILFTMTAPNTFVAWWTNGDKLPTAASADGTWNGRRKP